MFTPKKKQNSNTPSFKNKFLLLIEHLSGFLKEKKNHKKFTSLIYVFVGFFLMSFSVGYRLYSQRVLSFSQKPIEAVSHFEKVTPVRIIINKANVNLSIDNSSIIDGVWEISEKNASYLDISAGLNGNGNTVVYGHNKRSIFGPIRWLKKGDQIQILGSDGKMYNYVIEKTAITHPNDIDYVQPKDEGMLTIYTCTGIFDSQRFIIVAKPIK